jgi:3-phosphoshikimate 1-carboxyvinyltransferase
MIVTPSRLSGSTRVPGDKSVTHRAVILAAVAEGTSEIVHPGTGRDNLSTLSAIAALGVEATHDDPEHFTVIGRGPGALRSPSEPIDCGNSGTTARLLAGLLAGAGVSATLTGDASLSRRPMRRITGPLTDLGYDVSVDPEGRLPMVINGNARPEEPPAGSRAVLAIASAQVKSCILLAGLFRERPIEVVEPAVSRDHTERLLRALGARCVSTRHYLAPDRFAADPLAPSVKLVPGRPLRGREIEVPGDPSSAAFLAVAGVLVGDGVTVERVGTNPTRARFLDVLGRMGAQVSYTGRTALSSGEPAADVETRSGVLQATEIGGFEVPLLIDEIPILCVAGAASAGRFVVRDASELRVKESDRIERIAALLSALGVDVETTPDGLAFEGRGAADWDAFEFDCGDDHRIAMAAVVAALAARGPCALSNTDCIDVSYPTFVETLSSLGAEVRA